MYCNWLVTCVPSNRSGKWVLFLLCANSNQWLEIAWNHCWEIIVEKFTWSASKLLEPGERRMVFEPAICHPHCRLRVLEGNEMYFIFLFSMPDTVPDSKVYRKHKSRTTHPNLWLHIQESILISFLVLWRYLQSTLVQLLQLG